MQWTPRYRRYGGDGVIWPHRDGLNWPPRYMFVALLTVPGKPLLRGAVGARIDGSGERQVTHNARPSIVLGVSPNAGTKLTCDRTTPVLTASVPVAF